MTTTSKGKKLAMGLFVIAALALVTTFVTRFVSQNKMYGGQYGMEAGGGGVMMAEPSTVMLEETAVVSKDMGMASDRMMYPTPDTYMPQYPDYGGNALNVENRLYERYADFSVITKDVQSYLRGVREYVLSINGVVLSDSYNNSGQYKSGSLYVKVPVASFEQATIRATEGVKEVYSSSISSSDVTGMHQSVVDQTTYMEEELTMTKAQLQDAQLSLSKVEEGSTLWRQYRNEVLNLERSIRNIEKQIENLKQNVESIEDQVEYATLNITAADNKRYYEPMPYYGYGGTSLWYHFERARASLGEFGYMVAIFLVWCTVYAVVWVPAMIVFKLLKRKFSGS